VVYCVPVDNDQFAVGLQLFAAAGSWRSPNWPAHSGDLDSRPQNV